MIVRDHEGSVAIKYDGWTFTLTRNGGILVLNVRGQKKSAATILRRFGEEDFRDLFREALLALDHPYQWKGVTIDVPPEHRATPRGN